MTSIFDLIKYYHRYRWAALLSITASGIFELLDLIVPYAIGQIINVFSQEPLDPVFRSLVNAIAETTPFAAGKPLELSVLLATIGLVTVVKSPIQPWLSSWFHWEIALRARRDQLGHIIGKILTLPLSFYEENNPGRISTRISRGVENQLWTYPEISGQLLPKLIRVLGIFICISLIEWRIALAFLISFFLILGFGLKHLRKIIQQEALLDRYMENTQSRNSEIITNIKTVKAFASEAREYRRQNRRLEREKIFVIHRIHKDYVSLETWQKTVVQLSIFLVILWSLIETLKGHISLGHFITLWTISSMAYAELEPMTELAEIFARRYSSMARLHQLMQLPAGKDAPPLDNVSKAVKPYHFQGRIEFRQVNFGYESNRNVLKDITLSIQPRQTVALVGRSGSGKSTLIKLLFRYFQPQSGQICIDGQNIEALEVSDYRQRLAIVHQEVDVFNGTVLDNLKYGNPNVSLSAVVSACKIARVDEFIDELPDRYYTIVGERGVRLSGGQRQRLGIARALIVNPDILIFDEATSSLDYESERAIQLAMRSILGTRTTIIIAHRLSTIREADVIVVLDAGRIVEVGSHEALLNQQGIYHRLNTLQERGDLLN